MRILGAMCLMGLLAGCASGPHCTGRLVPINLPPTVRRQARLSTPVSATAPRTVRSRRR
jgi:hypothetical protein